jgi:tetratricopeptide (TPR) repeat protein
MIGGTNELHISVVGSEYGDISDNTRSGIEMWMAEPTIPEDEEVVISASEGSTVTSTSASHLSVASARDAMSETTPTIPSSDSQSQFGDPLNFDSNSNQDLELFWVFVRKGDEKYKSRKYPEAERYYHKVLDRSRKFQIAFDKNDIYVKLGIACFEQRKWDQAQAYFNMVPNGNDMLLKNFIQTGNRKADLLDRESACVHFEKALAMSTDLPFQTRRDLHSKAGIAYFQQEKWADAKEHFLAVAEVGEDSVADLRCFEAEHYLARIHVQEADLDGAEKRCLAASTGRWRILGKSHALWHESIALLVEIYTAKGDPLEADGYAALLPEGYRSVSFPYSKVGP